MTVLKPPQALVLLSVVISFCRFSQRGPDFWQMATISQKCPIGSDSMAVAYRTRSGLGFKRLVEVAIMGSYPLSFSSLRTVCTAIFMTCRKHLLDYCKVNVQLFIILSESLTECDYHGSKMES